MVAAQPGVSFPPRSHAATPLCCPPVAPAPLSLLLLLMLLATMGRRMCVKVNKIMGIAGEPRSALTRLRVKAPGCLPLHTAVAFPRVFYRRPHSSGFTTLLPLTIYHLIYLRIIKRKDHKDKKWTGEVRLPARAGAANLPVASTRVGPPRLCAATACQ